MLPLLATLWACRPADVPDTTTPPPTSAAAPTAHTAHTASTPPSPTATTGLTATSGHTGTGTEWTGEPTASPYVLRSGPPPDNVLLLTFDTTRYDHLNSNGYTVRTTSPRIDALLAEGLALRNHRSCSAWTMASFLCLLSGRDQLALGLWPDNNNKGAGVDPLPFDMPGLALRLKEEGFATGLVYANSFLSSKYGMGTGHDIEEKAARAPVVNDDAVEVFDELLATGQRWFFHVHYNDPHTPYDADESWLDGTPACPLGPTDTKEAFLEVRGRWGDATADEQEACLHEMRLRYDAGILEADAHLGELLDHLDSLGQLERTLVVFATDHGEEFFEHGEWEHGHSLYQGLNRATAGFVYPPRIAPAEHHGLTTHVDLRPTLLEVLDLPPEPDTTGTVVGSEPVDHVFGLVYRNELTTQSVTTATDTLIYHWDGRLRQYDDAADPLQTTDLYDPDSAESQALWALLEPKVDELASRVTDGSVPVGRPRGPASRAR